ncbi:KilA-N domain-containing protein [Sphingobacterium olei]|uniref:KilA-N domain-containing protein n=1 Tax=Sphingobacterium olei TaxID=2571155 RepID=UPI001EE3BA43|nr:KilA-N domain-containing protein [Sphingobacterium olei]
MSKSRTLQVKESKTLVIIQNETDFINLTDMTSSFREGSGLIGKWITNKNTLEYLGVWEKINNLNFNYPEFGVIEQEAGTNRFIMSVGQWIKRTSATGMIVKSGRYGGTFAHQGYRLPFCNVVKSRIPNISGQRVPTSEK